MILFGLAAAVLVAAVLAVLLRPLLRPSGAVGEGREPLLAMYHGQLAELDAELAQGRLDAAAAAAARTEITRRMLSAADAHGIGEAEREAGWRLGMAVAIAGIIPAGALAIYLAVGMPAAILGPPNHAGHDAAELSAAADRLRQHLQSDPGDVAGWALFGRTMAALGRVAEAGDAFRHAVALAPGDPELHAQLGEMLVAAAKGTVTTEAAAEFGKAPHDPRSRFYAAEAALQRGDAAAAKSGLEALLNDTPKEAPYRQVIAARLQQIATNGAGAAAAEAEAEAKKLPAEQMDMIRGMVGRLEARLEAHPEDPKGWLMLARSYRVLGRAADARAALKRANAANPGNLDLMKAYLDALSEGLSDAHLPPELVALAGRINALDASDPAALWYLGLDDAARGDKAGASGYWRRLLTALPAADGRRTLVQQRLDALR